MCIMRAVAVCKDGVKDPSTNGGIGRMPAVLRGTATVGKTANPERGICEEAEISGNYSAAVLSAGKSNRKRAAKCEHRSA